jgi:hypothetical protein
MAKNLYDYLERDRVTLAIVTDKVKSLPIRQETKQPLIINKPDNLTIEKYISLLTFPYYDEIKDLTEDQECFEGILNNQVYLVDILNQETEHQETEHQETEHQETEHKQLNDLAYLNINKITVDPKKFQFKIVHGLTGSTGSLKSVKQWNKDLSGVILVWYDQENNLIYCINGHNRIDTAKKLNVESIAVRFIKAKNEQEARLVGAVCNIAEGNGTIYDISKFIKDSKLSLNELRNYGINIKSKIVDQALSICQLSGSIYEDFMQGHIEINIAVYASKLNTASLQKTFIALCNQKNVTREDQLIELVSIVESSSQSIINKSSLFGLDFLESNNAVEKAILIDYCLSRLKQDKRIFDFASQNNVCKSLEKNNNILDKDRNKKSSQEAEMMISLFNQLKLTADHDIAKHLNIYAKQLKDTKKQQIQIKQQCYYEIVSQLNKELERIIFIK